MNKIKVLFFWASGIFFQTFDCVITETLSSFVINGINLNDLPLYQEMKENLMLGKINDQEFCRNVMKIFGMEEEMAESFRERIFNRPALIHGILEAISEVKSEIAQWLVVDLPEVWFKQLPFFKKVSKQFSPDRIIYMGNSHLLRVIPYLFYYLPNKVQVPSDQCLLLDKNIKRTVCSINHGLPAAVIINPEGLRREFLLRRLIMQDYPVHQRPV